MDKMFKVFKVKFVEPDESELNKIGFDKSYVAKGMEKHNFVSLKIYNLNPAQANILKQTALSSGTDCAVHRDTITGIAKFSDCILSGSVSEVKKICEKLKYQPFSLSKLALQISSLMEGDLQEINVRGNIFDWSRPLIMGILNVTPDSFSDGGVYFDEKNAVSHALELIENGADIIDIGGESTRPYSKIVHPEDEIKRIIPVLKAIRELNDRIVISVDTRNAQTASAALVAGADIVNDVSAMEYDKDMLSVIVKASCPVILNHSRGTPDVMQENTVYSDVTDEIYNYFCEKIKLLTEEGISLNRIIVDPGIGFGKNTEQNFEIIKKIEQFKSLGVPILVGHSRKTFLQKTFETKDKAVLDEATNLVSGFLLSKGVNILRVHDVKRLKMSIDLAKIFYS